jgi:hypothetical protein
VTGFRLGQACIAVVLGRLQRGIRVAMAAHIS